MGHLVRAVAGSGRVEPHPRTAGRDSTWADVTEAGTRARHLDPADIAWLGDAGRHGRLLDQMRGALRDFMQEAAWVEAAKAATRPPDRLHGPDDRRANAHQPDRGGPAVGSGARARALEHANRPCSP